MINLSYFDFLIYSGLKRFIGLFHQNLELVKQTVGILKFELSSLKLTAKQY